MTTEWSAPR